MTQISPVLRAANSPEEPPGQVSGTTALPLRTTDFDAGLAALYQLALAGASTRDVLTALCQQLAKLLRVPLAVLARRLDSGAVAHDAASREDGLWLEMQHIPERWDSGLSSRGPAAECLRARAAVRMGIDTEGFALWRASAAAEGVHEVVAIPVPADDGLRVLELFCDAPLAPGATAGTLSVDALARKVSLLLANLQTIERNALLARALASAGNGIFITDLEGTIVWSNEAFSALSGYSADEVRGKNPSILRSGNQGLRYYRELWGTIRGGKVWSGETVDRAKDGTPYVIQQTVSPVASDGRITHYVSIHQDIGRQRQAQSRLELASHLDPASGLLTRAAFEAAGTQALAEADSRCFTLVLVSLRGLQGMALTIGDDLQDFAAAVIGKRLRAGLAPTDLAGVYGPFEYAVLLASPCGDALNEWVQGLAERLNEPIPLLGESLQLDAHFGIATFPKEGPTLHDLTLKADRRLADQPYRRARRKAEPN